MATELNQIQIASEEDILQLHELCMQLGRRAALPVMEQIHFATGIATRCHTHITDTAQVRFSVEERGNQAFLTVEIQNHSKTVVDAILQPIAAGNSFSFAERIALEKNLSEKGYRDMQQFTFALAHDLKNSLTKLTLALALVEDEEIPPAINNYIQIIHRAAQGLGTIMLGLNKIIEIGDSSPDVVKRMSPGIVFADVHEKFTEALAKKEAVVTTDFSVTELNYIEVYLKSIFSNLISNAIKYSSSTRPLRLSVSSYWYNGKAAFVFSDNGQGIDLKTAGDKLFQPFTRFSSSSEGSGIGLYLVKNIAERNGGKVEVESIPGEGTTFRFFLKEYELPVSSQSVVI